MSIIIGANSSIAATGTYNTSTPLQTPAVTTNSNSSFLVVTTNYQYYSGNLTAYNITDSKGNLYQYVNSISDTINGGCISSFICINGIGGSSHTANVAPLTSLSSGISYFIEIVGGNLNSLINASSNGRFNGGSGIYNTANVAAGSATITSTKRGAIIAIGISSLSVITSVGTGWSFINSPIAYEGNGSLVAGTYSPNYTLTSGSSGAQILIALAESVIRQYANGAFLSSQFIESPV